MLFELVMAEDQGYFSKACDHAPQLFSMFPNTDCQQYIVRDVALLVPSAIDIQNRYGFHQLR